MTEAEREGDLLGVRDTEELRVTVTEGDEEGVTEAEREGDAVVLEEGV